MAYQSTRWTGQQLDNLYPVGAIYLSTVPVNSDALFGGTWEQIENRFLLAAGSSYTAGSTGGSATNSHTHTQVAVRTVGPSVTETGSTALTVANLPSHYHELPAYTWAWGNQSASNTICIRETVRAEAVTSGNYMHSLQGNWNYSLSTGSGTGHTHSMSHTHDIGQTTTGAASDTNNLPPYLVVYMYKRVA